VHVRDYPFDNIGIEHNPGLEAQELVRSWYSDERRHFLSWISRRAPPPLARAAKLVMRAKNHTEGFTEAYANADRALERLDAMLPSKEPAATLLAWLYALRAEEIYFLEGGSETVQAGGIVITRAAPRGAAWAASLAAAIRPHLFAMGSAPLALCGLLPRRLFRELQEEPLQAALRAALDEASASATADLDRMRVALSRAQEAFSSLNASSTAPQAWRVLIGLGPLNRAELARALAITKRTSSLSVGALQTAGLLSLRESDGAIISANADPAEPA
jgi:hypothetical protein